MRITNKMMVEHAIDHMNDNLDRLNTYNERASSGKNFSNISDDPSQTAMVLKLRSTLQTNQVYVDTDNATNEWTTANDSAFKDMLDIATRVNNLALQGKPDTLSATERKELGDEVNALLTHAVEIGNTSHMGNYLFSGYQVKTKPFDLNNVTDPSTGVVTSTVVYNGDSGIITQNISPGQKMSTNFPGDATYLDFYNSLIEVRDALWNNQSQDLDAALGDLASYTDTIKTARTTNGSRQRQIRMTLDTMGKTGIELKALLTQKEDANMAEAISMLTQQQTVYKSVLEVSSRAISTLSLFDTLS